MNWFCINSPHHTTPHHTIMPILTQIELVNRNGNGNANGNGSISLVGFDILVASMCIVLACFVLCFFCVCKRLRMRPPQNQHQHQESPEENENSIRKCAATWTFAEVDKATDHFSGRRLVGRGRYGAVYRAIFPDGRVVAVKRINPASPIFQSQGFNFSFSAEIGGLSRAHHPNVLPVIGYCETHGERIVGMPLLPGKSLQYHLHEGGNVMLLDWSLRTRILCEAAQGVEYLHVGTAPYIIHGNIKPSNILVDSMWSARVADFGLAFVAPPPPPPGDGYVDPQYYTQLNLSKASDVYSFGVVLLETLSGRPCFGGGGGGNIVEWAVPLINASRAKEIFDTRLAVPQNAEPLIRMAKVACRCVNVLRKNRPTMCEVVTVLKSIERDITFSTPTTTTPPPPPPPPPPLTFSASKTLPSHSRSHVSIYVVS